MTQTIFSKSTVEGVLHETVSLAPTQIDGLDVLFRGDEASHVRMAESRIVQASEVIEGKVSVRVLLDGREAKASTTNLTSEGLRAVTAVAAKRAAATPPVKGGIRQAEPTPLAAPHSSALDEATTQLDAADKAAWLHEAFAAHEKDDLSLAGRFHSGRSTYGVHSTTGVAAYHQGSWVDLNLSALERPAGHKASAYRAFFNTSVNAEAVDRLQREVRLECHRASKPIAVQPGEWDVVLAPTAVAELLEWMGTIAFGSRTMEDETSFLFNRLGQPVTGEHITIVDDASMPNGVGVPLPFDTEGQPKKRVMLVERGVARGIVYDTQSALRGGCSSTGHAYHSDDSPSHGSQAAHLILCPGTSTPDELIRKVSRGLLITRLHYVNGMLEPRRAVMTGLLRDGAFLIEGGKVGKAVETLRFTDSILEAFSRIPGIDCLSSNLEAHNSWFGPDQCFVAPWMLVPQLRFTSGR